MADLKIGLVGAGTVGGGVVKILAKQSQFFANALGLPIAIQRIVDTNGAVFGKLPVGSAICSRDASEVLSDPSIQVVIELVGGTTFARDLVLGAIAAKKHVVTANKALLALYGPEIFEAAEREGVSVYFEASVGGGMPIIKTVRESLVTNDIASVRTIINGTCNYILTRMERENVTFADALRRAQEKGFAEADPAMDVGGGDTGHKIAILASLLYGGYVPFHKIPIEGVTEITRRDIRYAADLGYRIKLLGIINEDRGAGLDVRVHPTLLPLDHILASVSNEFNAVLIEGDAAGQILLYGRGAGEMPTASAVVADVVDLARNLRSGAPQRIPMGFYNRRNELRLLPVGDVVTRYFLRFTVVDRPKVLAAISSVLGDHGISIASVVQRESESNETVAVIMVTHPARERDLRAAVAQIQKLEVVKEKAQIIRIEG
ncbi:MAG: homoserine dehydrogenase [Planctomycetota bacterium]